MFPFWDWNDLISCKLPSHNECYSIYSTGEVMTTCKQEVSFCTSTVNSWFALYPVTGWFTDRQVDRSSPFVGEGGQVGGVLCGWSLGMKTLSMAWCPTRHPVNAHPSNTAPLTPRSFLWVCMSDKCCCFIFVLAFCKFNVLVWFIFVVLTSFSVYIYCLSLLCVCVRW